MATKRYRFIGETDFDLINGERRNNNGNYLQNVKKNV